MPPLRVGAEVAGVSEVDAKPSGKQWRMSAHPILAQAMLTTSAALFQSLLPTHTTSVLCLPHRSPPPRMPLLVKGR